MRVEPWKILLCIVLALIIGFVGFLATIFTAFAGGDKYYVSLVIVITCAAIVFVTMGVIGTMRPKRLLTALLIFVGICSVVTVGYSINKRYQSSLPTINEQGVNLREYMPFVENTKAVALDEEASLKLEENLPILDGATALYPLYSAFVQAVYPQKAYDLYDSEVMCNKTSEAYKNLMQGRVDIVFAARPSKQQIEEAKSLGIELQLTPIGREAFVFFVNYKNEVNGLTTAQIQDIYSGKVKNWRTLGGRNEDIRAFQRPENSGSQTMLQKIMEGKELIAPPKENISTGMGGIIARTADYKNYRNAIGYSFLFFATEMVKNHQIKLLEVDGVYPNRNTIRNNEYPLATEFYAVTAGSRNPNVRAFIEWVLSPQGQHLIEKTGYTPLNE